MSTTPDIEVVTAGSSREHVSVHSLEPEIIIIGAGVAGCALAYSLSHAGRSVVLLERDLTEPDRIVGELLQPGGVAALDQLGLGGPEGVLEGIDAVPVEGYCVVNGTDGTVGIPYPLLEEMGEGKSSGSKINGSRHTDSHLEKVGPGEEKKKWHVDSASGKKEGRSFHHGRLISALRKKVINEAPGVTVLEASVRELVFCEHTNRVIGVSAAFKKASTSTSKSSNLDDVDAPPQASSSASVPLVRKIYAPITIIADGCFSKFRQLPGTRIPTPDLRSHFVGAILEDCELPMKHFGTVCLTPRGPVLLYQIGNEKGEVRMLVDVKGKLPSVADGSLKRVILDEYMPHLPATLHTPLRAALDSQRLRVMPNSFLPPSIQGLQSELSGAILVGDAYNMRHPLTGGGMTVAFNDAVLLTKYLRPSDDLPAGREGLEDWNAISEKLREWFWERKKVSSVVNVLSIALYDLFGGVDEPDLEILRQGCFKYFELGGDRVAGPVGLLSALTPKRVTLFYHFFSVAFYSIWILLTRGTPKGGHFKSDSSALIQLPMNVLLSFRVFWTACVVLLPVFYTEFKI